MAGTGSWLPDGATIAPPGPDLHAVLAWQVADQVVGVAHRLTTGQLKARLRTLVLTADPDAFAKAARVG